MTLTACGLAPREPEERQRDQPARPIEHAVSHGTRTILRVRLVILIEACMERHEHKGEARPAPVPCSRCPCPQRPQQEARQESICGEMRGFAGEGSGAEHTAQRSHAAPVRCTHASAPPRWVRLRRNPSRRPTSRPSRGVAGASLAPPAGATRAFAVGVPWTQPYVEEPCCMADSFMVRHFSADATTERPGRHPPYQPSPRHRRHRRGMRTKSSHKSLGPLTACFRLCCNISG